MFKKLTILAVLALSLTACAQTPGLSDSKALYTIGGRTISENDQYNSLLDIDQGLTIYADISKQLQDVRNLNEEGVALVEQRITNELENLNKQFEGQLETAVKGIGFKNVEEFVAIQLRPAMIANVIMENDLEANFEQHVKDFKVRNIQFIATDVEGFLDDARVAIEAGTEMSAIDLKEKAKFYEMMVSKSLQIEVETVKTYLEKNTTPGLSKVIYDEDSKLYYLIEILDTDFSDQKDEVKALLIAKESFQETFMAQQFINTNLRIYDASIYKDFKKLKPTFIR